MQNRVEYDDGGELDEVVTDGGAHLERMSRKGWFLSCVRADGTEFCVWFRGKVTMTEERPAPKWGRMGEWQPIETAPKDGTPVLVYVPNRQTLIAWYCEETGLWPEGEAYNEDGEPCNVGMATHWMPRPAPPAD